MFACLASPWLDDEAFMVLGQFGATNGQLDCALRNVVVANNFNFYNSSQNKCDE